MVTGLKSFASTEDDTFRQYLNNLDGLGYIIMPWTFGHTCQSTVWQPACQCGEAYSGRDKRYTVPAFTLLHCALLGADLGEICNSKQLFEKNIFSAHEYRIWEAGFKLHIATTGDHFVFSLPLAVSNVEDLRIAAMAMYLRLAVPTVYFVFSLSTRKTSSSQQGAPHVPVHLDHKLGWWTARESNIGARGANTTHEVQPCRVQWWCLTAAIKVLLKYTLLSL